LAELGPDEQQQLLDALDILEALSDDPPRGAS
jgi:hypothetical protein